MNKIIVKKTLLDISIILILMFSMLRVFEELDMFESLVEYVKAHEDWELDEVILTLLISPLFFIWFVLRRWRDEYSYWVQRIEKERDFSHKLKFDELSDLPNSSYFEILVERQINQLSEQQKLMMVVIEVRNFDTLERNLAGAGAAEYTSMITDIIKKSTNESSVIARLGKDVFAISSTCSDSDVMAKALTSIEKELKLPVFFLSLGVEFKVGVATLSSEEEHISANTLIHRATSAIHSGNFSSDCRFFFYDLNDSEKRIDALARKTELKKAINNDEMVLYLQPQVDAIRNTVAGAEALIRWQHPEKGLIMPYQFIELAQDNPLATDLGEWVVSNALETIERFGNALSISVSIFPQHIQNPDFPERLSNMLKQYPNIISNKLKLEITELGTISDYDVVIDNMNRCRELGVLISLDDFGTGHSSLNQLRILPVDEIKMDRSFVSDFLINPVDNKMVRSVLSLASAFNLNVVSEGIETPEQRDALMALGGTLQQGYFYSKPLAQPEFIRWLELYNKKSDAEYSIEAVV